MNILYIVNSLSINGGIQRIAIDKANALNAVPGINMHIIAMADDEDSNTIYPLDSSISVLRPGLYMKSDLRKEPFKAMKEWLHLFFKMNSTIRDYIKSNNIDIVSNMFYLLHRPIVSQDCIYIYESHGRKMIPNLGKFKSLLHSCFYRYNSWKSKLIVCLTEEEAGKWREFKTKKVIPNFTVMQPVSPYNPDSKRIIMASRIDMDKGFDILLETWKNVHKKHPDWHLDIYGNDNDGKSIKLESYIKQADLQDTFHLCGFSDNMPRTYSEHSFFVLSSRHEGLPMVLIESMACGLPCVSFDCPAGPRDIISDGTDGLLVPYRGLNDFQRINGLTDAICRMIEERDMRIRFSHEAIKNVRRFNKENVIGQWIELFKSLMEESKAQ